MARIIWDRRENIKDAFSLIPPVVQKSTKDFRPPATIEDDFRRLLQHDVPHVNFTFELVRDWYAMGEADYQPLYIRAQQTPIDWKSKIGNSDMNTNFKTTHDVPIHKGDLVIREDGTVFLLNWTIQNHANNQATQSSECNSVIEFTRYFPDVTDEEGYLITPGGRRVVIPPIPATHVEYAGRPDYSNNKNEPGVSPDHLITVYLQWNPTTKNIFLDDQFQIGVFTYKVINISIAEVNIDKDYGILTLNAKRVAGGDVLDGDV